MKEDDYIIEFPVIRDDDITEEVALKILYEMSILMARLYHADKKEYGEEEAGELLYNSCIPLIVLCGFEFIEILLKYMEDILEYEIPQSLKDVIISALNREDRISADDILKGLYEEGKEKEE